MFARIGGRGVSRRFYSAVTSLYDFHVENGGKIVNFGGYLLPVQYGDLGISQSHLHTRKLASLFDVSHMLQTEVLGRGCVDYIESICTADVQALKNDASTLTVFTNEKAGILDDLIVTKINDEHLYIVSNAARKDHDQKHFLQGLMQYRKKNPSSEIVVRFFEPEERSLLAFQGPQAAKVLQKFTSVNLAQLYFMNSTIGDVAGVNSCRITRCGYTGEDGFEISFPAIKSNDVANELLRDADVKLAGLGARDSLRLEAGLCLYGSDITTETTPVEAGLTWLVAKRRREAGDFPGADVIARQVKDGTERKRVGLVAAAGPPARHGTEIYDGERRVGVVTSGCPSPSLGKNIAMSYVANDYAKTGTRLSFKLRDKLYEAVVTKMPFVQCNYYSKPK